VAGIVLGGSTQIFFLTSILPQVLPDLGVADDRTLEVGGPRDLRLRRRRRLRSVLASRLAELRARAAADPGLPRAVVDLRRRTGAGAERVGLRRAPASCRSPGIAPVFPLAVARIAQSAGGVAIGVVNSARIGAAFVGPVLATTLLAWSAPGALYASLALIGWPVCRSRGA